MKIKDKSKFVIGILVIVFVAAYAVLSFLVFDNSRISVRKILLIVTGIGVGISCMTAAVKDDGETRDDDEVKRNEDIQ